MYVRYWRLTSIDYLGTYLRCLDLKDIKNGCSPRRLLCVSIHGCVSKLRSRAEPRHLRVY